MKTLGALLTAALLLVATAVYAAEVAINVPPPFAFQAPDSPKAPQILAIVSCQADDLTGQPGRHGWDGTKYDETQAAKGWRDLEPHIVNGELICKVEYLPLEDAVTMYYPRKGEGLTAEALNSDFGDPGQCGRVGAFIAPEYNKSNWAVVAIGCPSPIVNGDGKIIDWTIPSCPRSLGSYKNFTCRFTPRGI